ncbi:hypothetical protein LINGRAHAP2_LOCUS20169, partial [Linum grandiflorum]
PISTQHPTSPLPLTHLPTHPPTSIQASIQLQELLQSSSPSPIFPIVLVVESLPRVFRMTPCPCSPHAFQD